MAQQDNDNQKITQLIKRNLSEIITGEELSDLISTRCPGAITAYCGYETSGPVHIGTMIAVNKQVDFQNAGMKVKVLFADLHTYLNRKGTEAWIDEMIEYWTNAFKAIGLNKSNVEYVRGSDFQYNKEYIRDILELGLDITLKRAIRSMQDIARDIEHARVSQMMYPLMQIADMKALNIDLALGGMEQRKIHVLAREIMEKINFKKPVCLHNPLLCSLQGPATKMSSSKPETMIRIEDSPGDIEKKLNKAFCPPGVEGNPIAEICRYIIFPKIGKLDIKRPEKFGGDVELNNYGDLQSAYLEKRLHPADLKKAAALALCDILEPVRDAGLSYPANT